MDCKEILEFDNKHIWHPYTSMINPLPVYPVRSAEGVYITLETGECLIDGMSSWWCVIHGYNNPRLNAAVEKQLQSMSHVMFGGLTHRPAIELAMKLVEMTPEGLDKVFFCDSGSVSVEVAAKMALQYMQAAGKCSKTKFATVRGGYHGDTWHAMSVCDPETGMHALYSGRVPFQYFADRPSVAFDGKWDKSYVEDMGRLLEENHDEIAAVILEPVVQGAGGMWMYHPEYLKAVKELCERYGVLMIADEVATGFGRTGKMFACEWAGITPDIMCLGKAITGGYMSFATVLATDDVAMTISKAPPHVFMHGPTFMGNPLACAVANASLDIVKEPDTLLKVAEIEKGLKRLLAPAKDIPKVCSIRILGAIGVIEFTETLDVAVVQKMCVQEGVWIRPFGRLMYIMPPYIISQEELEKLCGAMIRIAGRL